MCKYLSCFLVVLLFVSMLLLNFPLYKGNLFMSMNYTIIYVYFHELTNIILTYIILFELLSLNKIAGCRQKNTQKHL